MSLEKERERFRKLARLAKGNGHEGERAAAKAAAMLHEFGEDVLAPSAPAVSPRVWGATARPFRESKKARLAREAARAELLRWRSLTPEQKAAEQKERRNRAAREKRSEEAARRAAREGRRVTR